jgi:hypothetical protein
MSIREVLGSFPGAALLVGLVLGGLWAWEQRRKRRLHGLDIDTQDPIWTAAIARARDSLPRFRELAAQRPNDAFVKYPLQTTAGAVEHVWGHALAVNGDTIVANIETPPVDGAPAAPPPYNISIAEVED